MTPTEGKGDDDDDWRKDEDGGWVGFVKYGV